MEIIKEIKESQGRLSKVNIDFLEYTEKNPETLNRSNYKLLELNDHLFTLQPWPTFINRKTKQTFKEVSLKLFNLIKSIPKRVFNNDPGEISRYFEIPRNAAEIQLEGFSDDDINNLVGRGDFIISPTGLKCLEYNVSPYLGGVQIPIWESLYLNTPILSRFFREYNVKIHNENLISLLLEQTIWSPLKSLTGDDEINIAIISEGIVPGDKQKKMELYLKKLYKELLQKKDKFLTGEVILCDYPFLKVVANDVFFRKKKIHALIELYHGLVPPRIMEAFKAGNVSITNGPISNLLSNKLMLAVLSDYETVDVFSSEEKKIIDTYVPWSRKINQASTTYGKEKIENLQDFILSNKEKLVIKPSMGLGGEGICVGCKCTGKKWEEVVNNAIKKKHWLVQERVDYSTGLYQVGENDCTQQDMVWGFFVFGFTYGGSWVRVMPRDSGKGVINCHQGATVSVIFEVDE